MKRALPIPEWLTPTEASPRGSCTFFSKSRPTVLYIHYPGMDLLLNCALTITLHYYIKPGAQ
jgi:hypothetical protein